MYGKLLNTIINILFITYLLLLVSFYFLHEGIKENVNNINYTTVDTVSTQGVFNVDTYNNLKEKIFAYAGADCNYELTIKYQERKAPGVYNTKFVKDTINATNLLYPIRESFASDAEYQAALNRVDPNHIITTNNRQPKPMYKGDQITIYLEDQNQTLYGKLITTPFMGMLDNYVDFRIKSLKTSMIGRDANKLVNGYEVMDDINDPVRTYKVILITEMSTQAGRDGQPFDAGVKYDESNALYKGIGRDAGASPNIGMYHIFSTVNYYRVWDDMNTNGVEDTGDVVTYYQTTE